MHAARDSNSCASLLHQSRRLPCVELPALVVEAVRQLVADQEPVLP
jgi:hypothetical protein